MESTNELVTKAEANAEGFSVESTNECLTKAEFNANLPTPPQFSYVFPDNYREVVYIVNGSDSPKTLTVNSETITLASKSVWVRAYASYSTIYVTAQTNLTHNTCYSYVLATTSSGTYNVANNQYIANPGTSVFRVVNTNISWLLAMIYITA